MENVRHSKFITKKYISNYNGIIAKKIAVELDKRNLKRGYFARLAGISEQHLCEIISNKSNASFGCYTKIANSFGYETITDFFADIPELNKPFSEIK